MSSIVLRQGWRILLLVLLQVMIFSRIAPDYGIFIYIGVIIYPIFIILLPVKTPQALAVLLGFVVGLIIDYFYNSMGVHASACVFTAFIRPYILNALAPRTGYTVNQSPTKKAITYYSVEAFTFVYIGDIFLRTFFSFVVSMFFVIAYQYIFDPE